MTDQAAIDPPQPGPTSEQLWTDVELLGRLTQRASQGGEQMAAVVFAAAGHASAMRVARTRPAKMQAAVEAPAKVEPDVPVPPAIEEPVEEPIVEQIDWPEPEPQPVAQTPDDLPATYPLLGEAMSAALGDDDSETVDMQAPAPPTATPRVSRARRMFHWAALIAFATIAGLLYTGRLNFPVIDQAIARQAMDSILPTIDGQDPSGNLPPALDAEPTSPSAAAPVEIDSQPALVDPRAAAEPVAVDKPAAPADEPPLIILPTDDADGVDAEPPADDSQSSVHTLFDEPLGDADWSHVPAPSLFGPDPIVAASIVADAQPMRDEPAEDYFAQDVAQWIAAHQQAWFPAPQAVRTPVRRRQQQPQRPVAPQWLDDIIHNAVSGGAIPSMLEPSAAMLP